MNELIFGDYFPKFVCFLSNREVESPLFSDVERVSIIDTLFFSIAMTEQVSWLRENGSVDVQKFKASYEAGHEVTLDDSLLQRTFDSRGFVNLHDMEVLDITQSLRLVERQCVKELQRYGNATFRNCAAIEIRQRLGRPFDPKEYKDELSTVVWFPLPTEESHAQNFEEETFFSWIGRYFEAFLNCILCFARDVE